MSDIACVRLTTLLWLSLSSGLGSKPGYASHICLSLTPAAVRQALSVHSDAWGFVYALSVASSREIASREKLTSDDLGVWLPVLSWMIERWAIFYSVNGSLY
jgi:hypothetical protein